MTPAEVNAALDDCCDHFEGHPTADAVIVANSYCGEWGREREGWDDESFVIFTDASGAFWAAWESSDSTGHGCQCSGGFAGPYPTLRDAVFLGLTADQREGYTQAGGPEVHPVRALEEEGRDA